MNSSPIAVLEHEITMIVEIVVRRTLSFMKTELRLNPLDVGRGLSRAKSIGLRDVTAIVGVGSSAGLNIAFSYDDSLIREIMSRYTAELSISQEEVDTYVHETASDIVNVIVGNCTADVAKRGETIRLSPPVLMIGARTIHCRAETTVASIRLRFAHGELDVAFVGPRSLFDERLCSQGTV